MITYKKFKIFNVVTEEAILKIDDYKICIIPFDEGNIDYKQYQEWLAEGNTPLDSE